MLPSARFHFAQSHIGRQAPYARNTTSGGRGLHALLAFVINLDSHHSCERERVQVPALQGKTRMCCEETRGEEKMSSLTDALLLHSKRK